MQYVRSSYNWQVLVSYVFNLVRLYNQPTRDQIDFKKFFTNKIKNSDFEEVEIPIISYSDFWVICYFLPVFIITWAVWFMHPLWKLFSVEKKSFKKKNYVKIMTKNLLRISTRKKQPWAICIFLTDKFECTLLGNHFRTGP